MTCQLGIPDMFAIEQLKVVMQANISPPPEMVADAEEFLGYQFALVLLLWTTLWAVKFSLLLFFWRIFESVRTRVRAFWWLMCFVTASTYIVTIFLQFFACGSPQNFLELGTSHQRSALRQLTRVRRLQDTLPQICVQSRLLLFDWHGYCGRHLDCHYTLPPPVETPHSSTGQSHSDQHISATYQVSPSFHCHLVNALTVTSE